MNESWGCKKVIWARCWRLMNFFRWQKVIAKLNVAVFTHFDTMNDSNCKLNEYFSINRLKGNFFSFFRILKSVILKEKTGTITSCASIIKVVVFLFCFLKKRASEGVSNRKKKRCHYELRVQILKLYFCFCFLKKNALLKEFQSGSKTVVITSCAFIVVVIKFCF